MNDVKFVDSAISQLLNLKADPRLNSSMPDQIHHLLSELEVLQLYVLCLVKWNEALQGKKNRHLGVVNSHIKATLAGATKDLYRAGINALAAQDFQDWNNLVYTLFERIKLSKPKIEKDSRNLLKYCSIQCRFSIFELEIFYSSLSNSLDEIGKLKSERRVDMEMQIQGIKDNLHFFSKIFELTREVRSSNKDLKNSNVRMQAWAYKAACLSLLYRVQEDENREEMPIFFSTPEVTTTFLASLEHLWSLSHNCFLMNECVPKFVDFMVEILRLSSLKNGIQNLRSNLTSLTTFLLDPPVAEEYKNDVESLVKEVQSLICSLNADQIEEGTADDFQKKLEKVKGKVSELYMRIFLDASFDFPRLNVLGFIDSFMDDLKEILHSVLGQQVDEILEGLLSLRYFVNGILDVDVDLWRRIVDVICRVKISINMFLYMNECVCYNMKFLWDAREEINLINIKVEECQNQQFKETISRHSEMSPRTFLTPVGSKPNAHENNYFKDEWYAIVDVLLHGTRQLQVVSIIGMAGLGKTTLAKMVCDHPSVSNQFNIFVWCQVRNNQCKKILVEILTMLPSNHYISYMEKEDLEEYLFQSLKAKRYLIVLDDVRDHRLLGELRRSFPDDQNGSRILVTTRHGYLEEGINFQNSYDLHLRHLSDKESWYLLQKIISRYSSRPLEFVSEGLKIARNCNGLPRAITLIAGLLLEKVYEFDWWNQVADTLYSHILTKEEDCDKFIELSYQTLPENLKACFLYFRAFQENKVIRARKLIQLWVAEGLIQKFGGVHVEEVAQDYLTTLVSRGLVVVTDRCSTNRIKTCKLDNYVYEFCLAKCEEEQFVAVKSGDVFFYSKGAVCKNYRVCIENGGDRFFASNPLGPCVHSLLFFPDYTCLNKGDLFSICNFKLLHVLDLEDTEFNGCFPEEVTRLVLLRYLAVWCPSGIFSIPPSIAKLRNLENFRVKREVRIGTEICLPDTLWKMKKLRHIDVGGFTTGLSCDIEPEEESLALIDIEKFSTPSFSCGEDAEKCLRRLKNVRKLRCQFNDSCDPYQSGFTTFCVLPQLESLNVRYLGNRLWPFALNLPWTLCKLTLAHCRMPWSEMPRIIQNLPNLQVLKLLKDAFVGRIWEMNDEEFYRLKFLKLRELDIAEWFASADAFPSLQQLIVESCYELEGIPLKFGEIPYLKKIQVKWCRRSVADSASKILQEQMEWGNDGLETEIYESQVKKVREYDKSSLEQKA